MKGTSVLVWVLKIQELVKGWSPPCDTEITWVGATDELPATALLEVELSILTITLVGVFDKDGTWPFLVGPRSNCKQWGGQYLVASPKDWLTSQSTSTATMKNTTIFLDHNTISEWLTWWWLSTLPWRVTKQCPEWVSHRRVGSSIL